MRSPKNQMTNKFSIKFLALTLLCLAFGVGQVFAQAGNGNITGVVSDSSGAIVPNATVKLSNVNTGLENTTTASGEGIYNFTNLQPGRYRVSASSGSFAVQNLDVEVQVGRTTDANFSLGASDVSATVEVTAEGVQTTSSNSDAVINETAINNLPINGRRFQDFVTLTPTAQIDPSRGQISLSGQRGINTNINVDGVDYNQPFFGGIRGGERSNLAFTIPQESIKEFQVVAAGYSAEFGRSSGGIVNAVTKSGDNSLRGTAFYLLRPSRLSRGNKFSQALQDQKLTAAGVDATLAPTQQQFGGSIGGPILKDKLFFFGSYEQQRFRAPRQIVFNIPTGFAGSTVLTTAQQTVLNFFNGEQVGYMQTNDAYAALGRIDYNFNNNNRFNVRYNFSKNNALNAVSRGETSFDPTTPQSLSTNGAEGDKNNIAVAQLVSNFGSNSINELRLQYAREERPRESNSQLPQLLTGFATFGATAFLPTTQFDTRYQAADSFTYIFGNHTAKFGGEYSRLFASQLFGFNQFGTYALSIGSTAANVSTTLTGLSNVPSGAFLGRFDNPSARYSLQIGNREAAFKVHELAFFAQDTWRVTPKFTLNYGLRVEQQYNPEPEANNTQVINTVQNTVFPVRGRGFDPTQIADSGYQYGPRLGFAYDPKGDGKTVFRGFSGLYYARTPLLVFASSVNNFRTPPGDVSTTLPYTGFSQTAFNTFLATPAGQQYQAITGCNPIVTPLPAACTPNTVFRQFAIIGVNLNNSPLNNLPQLTTTQTSSIAGALGLSPNPFVGAQVTGHAEDFKNPISFQYGFGFEREVGNGFVIGIDYSHVKTTRLQRNRDLNLPLPISAADYTNLILGLASNNATITNVAPGGPTTLAAAALQQGVIDPILQANRQFIAVVAPSGISQVVIPIRNPTTGVITNTNFSLNLPTRLRPTNDPTFNPNAANRLALGAVQVRESTAKSLFRGITLRTRFVRKWGQINAYYTLSNNKSDDDNERDSGGVGYANPYDLRGEYSLSRLDRRHQFVANPVFFLPLGFEVSSAIRLRSGTPLNATVGGDLNGDGVNNDRPLLVPGITYERNAFRNRNIYDVDMRVQKGFKFDERKRLIFSGEFFNVFNQVNVLFPSPNSATSSGLTGQFCVTASQNCGLNGVTNVNFRQIREQNTTSTNFGNFLVNNTNPGSQAFQVQLGARFQF